MIFQYEFEPIITITPIIEVIVLFLLMIFMLYLYMKVRVWVAILVLYMFSLVIGFIAVNDGAIPFTPYLQIFFLVFQTILFFLTSFDAFPNRKK